MKGIFGLVLTLLATCASAKHTYDDPVQRSIAAQEDLAVLAVFMEDFKTNHDSYTSYLESNKLLLPETILQYYNHVTKLGSTVNIEEDIASSFPFTQFQTFMTLIPWYTSILKEAGATTFYVPDDFNSDTGAMAAAPLAATASSNGTAGNTTQTSNVSSDDASVSPSSKKTKTKESKTSHNNAQQNTVVPVALLGFLAILL